MANGAKGPRLAKRGRSGVVRHGMHVFYHVVEALVLVSLVGVAALAIRLASGPIYLESLHDRIASSLQDRTGNRYAVTLGATYVMHDSWGVGLGFRNLVLRDPSGRPVLTAPGGKIGLDPFALVLTRIKVKRLELDGLKVRLRVAADGMLSIAVSGDEGAAPIALSNTTRSGRETLNLAALIRDGAEAMAGADQALDRLTVANARFEIDNEATHGVVIYKDFNLGFDRSSEEARAQLSATGAAGHWSAEARASVSGAPTLALEARDMSLSDLEAFDKRPPPLFAEGPISFKFDARLAADESIQSLTGRFDVGAGQVRLNNPDALPFLVDEASGTLAWEDADKRLRVDDLVVVAGDSHVAASGWVSPPRDAAGAWAMRFESKDSRFAPERAGAQAVSLTSLVADATFSPSQSRFTLDNFAIRGPTVDVDLKADIVPDGPGVSLKLDMTVNPSVTPDVIRLWPQFINPDVRDWCAQNLHGGKIQGVMNANWSAADLDAMDHKRAVARESVHGSFTSHDVGVDLLPGLPIMVSSEASGRFTGRDFSLTANHAAMTLTPTRRVDADRLTFSIPDTSPKPIIDGEASAHVTATADSISDLLNREPLRGEAGLQIDPATVHGQAEGDLTLALKLGKTAKPADSQFHVTGSLKNLTLDKFIGEEKFEQATVAVDADRGTLKMNGDGQLFGAATHLEAGRAPGDDGSATLSLTLDQAARAKHKMNLAWLTGPLPVKIKAPLSRTSADVELDLTPAAIENPVPGVAKPAGKPGKATFQAKPATDGATIGNLAIDFGTVSMRGSADFGPDGAITAARIAQARISPGDDFKVDVVNSGNVVKATVHGSALDVRPFIKSLTELGSPSQASAKDIDIDMKLATVIGANRQSISGFELNASRRGGDDRLTLLRGRIGQGIVGATWPAGGDLRLVSTDAGALARFADLYARMEGGALDLSLRPGGDASIGTATITNFALRDEPAFRQLVAAAPAKAPGVVDPTLVRFQRTTVNFERMPGVLDIKDAIIYNPYMGLTTAGRINFSRNTIDVGGTFVPAYSVNTIVTKIPLVGLLLGGGQDEGVFGINYRVQRPIAAPQVSVNPLSAIAPGILRKMLGVIDGSGGHDFPPGEAVVTPRVR